MMWATMATASHFPSFTTPPLPSPTATANRSHAFTVSVKYQRRSRRRNNNDTYHYSDDDDVEAVDSKEKAEIEEGLSDSGLNFISEGGRREKQQPPPPQGISGSDILHALQRATAQKQKKKLRRISSDGKEKRDASATDNTSSSGGVESDVKPLRIRSDWSSRLDQLEKRLQELLQI